MGAMGAMEAPGEFTGHRLLWVPGLVNIEKAIENGQL